MNVKKLRYFAFALIAVAFCACQKEPSTSDLHRDYLVYTAHDTGTDFAAIDTYYIPDSILIIGNSDKTEYWKDADAMAIIGTVVGKLDDAGYTRTEDKDAASVGIQLSYVRKVTYFVGYDYPYWWWYYPYYWGSRLLGRLGGMALSLQRLLRVHGRFAADGNAGPPGRPGERQETAYRMGQLHRRPADLRRRPQPAAHDRRRRAGIRTVALPGQIV